MLQNQAILDQNVNHLENIKMYEVGRQHNSKGGQHVGQHLRSIALYHGQALALIRASAHLRHRADAMVSFLHGTLSLRDQVIAKGQNNIMVHLNRSAAFITFLALIYLPSSWVTVSVTYNDNVRVLSVTCEDILWYAILQSKRRPKSNNGLSDDMDSLVGFSCPNGGDIAYLLMSNELGGLVMFPPAQVVVVQSIQKD